MSVPLSNFTLLFSDVTTDPSFGFVCDSVRFDIPTTPCVWPLRGGCEACGVVVPVGISLAAPTVDGADVPPIPAVCPRTRGHAAWALRWRSWVALSRSRARPQRRRRDDCLYQHGQY